MKSKSVSHTSKSWDLETMSVFNDVRVSNTRDVSFGEVSAGEVSVRGSVREGICPWGDLTMRRFAHQGICPSGDLSIRGFVHQGICPSGDLSIRGICPLGDLSMRGFVRRGCVQRRCVRPWSVRRASVRELFKLSEESSNKQIVFLYSHFFLLVCQYASWFYYHTNPSCGGRVVKGFDSKSNRFFMRRFESNSQRNDFRKHNSTSDDHRTNPNSIEVTFTIEFSSFHPGVNEVSLPHS